MASLRRKNTSKYWYACFTDDAGIQRQSSTKEKDRARAQRIAEKLERAYRIQLTEAQARKMISEIYEDVRGEEFKQSTVRKFFTDWLAGKKHEMTPGSHKRYKNAVDKLLVYLGQRADRDVAYVDKNDITTLRNNTALDLSPSTANTDLKVIRSALRQAVNDGLRADNPAAGVKILDEPRAGDQPGRRPFTEGELKAILSAAGAEWKGLILAGLYTAQRLGDVAGITWGKVDLAEKVVEIWVRKKKKWTSLPIAEPLHAYLNERPKGKGGDPVFPNAKQAKVDAEGESRRLSAQFYELLVKVGLAPRRTGSKNSGRGHSVKRKTNELSFHCLRHTTTTLLKRAGVPESVVRDIVGHESALVSRAYTHVDEASKRDALKRLPSVA